MLNRILLILMLCTLTQPALAGVKVIKMTIKTNQTVELEKGYRYINRTCNTELAGYSWHKTSGYGTLSVKKDVHEVKEASETWRSHCLGMIDVNKLSFTAGPKPGMTQVTVYKDYPFRERSFIVVRITVVKD